MSDKLSELKKLGRIGGESMDSMVELILNGATEFTPEVLVRLFVFVMTLECIATIAYAVTSIGRR